MLVLDYIYIGIVVTYAETTAETITMAQVLAGIEKKNKRQREGFTTPVHPINR